MTDYRLHPRLLPSSAGERFDFLVNTLSGQDSVKLEDLGGTTSWNSEPVVFAATGPPRIGESELEVLRDAIVGVAKDAGFPVRPSNDALIRFDSIAARIWLDVGRLFPAEASVPEIWSFHSLVLLPDVTFWRWPVDERTGKSPNRERFVGSDLTRHAFARLWWRASMATTRSSEPDASVLLLDTLGEADLDQILTRRKAYGGSPEIFRSILRTWHHRSQIEPLSGLKGSTAAREVFRDFLKRLLRLGAFVSLDLLDQEDLDNTVEGLLDDALRHAGSGVRSAPAEDGSTNEVSGDEGVPPTTRDIDDVPLSDFPLLIAEVVAGRGIVARKELGDAIAHDLGITVPPGRLRLVRRMANVASVLGSVNKLEGRKGWEVGKEKPVADERWQDWTMNSLRLRAAELAQEKDDPAKALTNELFDGHPTKLANYVAGIAARESGAQS